MRKLMILLMTLTLALAAAIPAVAADYAFATGAETWESFGGATSVTTTTAPDPLSENLRRNKDAACLPPPYGVFSGAIPTDPSSPYHNNRPESGFVPQAQDPSPGGGESYAPGSGWLPSTSLTAALNITPWYYEDGSIGTLYVARTGETVKIYEGETADSMKKGAGHFASTSAWDGNVALAGHNRGSSAYFSFVPDLETGDMLIYTTKYGARTYRVYAKTQVSELDASALSWSADNILTLITCVADVPEMRFAVTAREVK
jgi:sortase A